jgi:hypothetical protein
MSHTLEEEQTKTIYNNIVKGYDIIKETKVGKSIEKQWSSATKKI